MIINFNAKKKNEEVTEKRQDYKLKIKLTID